MKIILPFLAALLSGCSTLATVGVGKDTEKFDCRNSPNIPRVYSGIANDVRFLKDPPQSEILFVLTDFPFSLVGDTLVLPYTITTQAMWGNLCSSKL